MATKTAVKTNGSAIAYVRDLRYEYPRSGKDVIGGYPWLGRMIDKVRAVAAGQGGDYSAFCKLSNGFLERCGVSKDTFALLVESGFDDAQIARHFDLVVSPEQKAAASNFILKEHAADLERSDKEEGRI